MHGGAKAGRSKKGGGCRSESGKGRKVNGGRGTGWQGKGSGMHRVS